MPRAVDASVWTEVDRRFAAFRERHHVPGVTYGVVIDGRLSHASSVGVRAAGNENARPTEATRSRICSMTKSFVAAAVLRLRDERRLALDDAVADHVPELGSLTPPTSDSPAVTIR